MDENELTIKVVKNKDPALKKMLGLHNLK